MLFVKALFANTSFTKDNRQTWLDSLLIEHDNSKKSNDYIFYCTGHHGIIWSLVVLDSLGISLYNGTTRKHIDYTNQNILDTLSFIKNNIKTICWGFDSLPYNAHLLKPSNSRVYNPMYNELYIVKDGNISFNYNDAIFFYSGVDSISFHNKLNKLTFLMLWLASPTIRPYLPLPNDTLLLK